MTRRLLLMVVVGTCFGFMNLQPSRGLEVDAEGTYISQGSNTSNTWHGRFRVGGRHMEGQVTFSGRAGAETFVAGWTDTRPPLASGTPCDVGLPSTSPDPNIMTAVGC